LSFNFDEYRIVKQNGAILSGTKTNPEISVKEYDFRSGVQLPNTLSAIDLAALREIILLYQNKLSSLQELFTDIQTLPDNLLTTRVPLG